MKITSETKKKLIVPIAAFALIATGIASSYASLANADTATQNQTNQTQRQGIPGNGKFARGPHHDGIGRGVVGTVTAINGNSITVTGPNNTTYTVDASGAKFEKVVTASISDIKVGDTIGAHGTTTGQTVTAQHIMTGMPLPPARAQK